LCSEARFGCRRRRRRDRCCDHDRLLVRRDLLGCAAAAVEVAGLRLC